MRSGLWWVVVLMLTAGCTRQRYDIEMSLTPEGKLQREFTVTNLQDAGGPGKLPEGDLERWSAIYDQPPQRESDTEPPAWTKTFDSELPPDVGGYGRLTRWETSLGDLVIYRERFRGTDDLASEIARRQEKLRRLCELLGGWCRETATSAEAGAVLEKFCTGTLQADLNNLLLLSIVHRLDDAAVAPDQLESYQMRAWLYLIEHGYLTPETVPPVARWENHPQEVLKSVVEMFERKLGHALQGQLTEHIPPLADYDLLEKSLREFLRNTPENQNNQDISDPLQLLPALAFEAMGSPLLAHDQLEVSFACPNEPVRTNGDWDPETKSLMWSASLPTADQSSRTLLPTMCFAEWAVPDEAAQTERFGKVLLTGQPLADYVQWRQSLSVDEGVDWDLFLLSLQPGENILERVVSFRFSAQETPPTLRSQLEERVSLIFQVVGNSVGP